MSGNARGQSFATAGKQPTKPAAAVVMAAFDRLPPDLRACLREATYDWPTDLFLERIRRGMSPAGAVAYVRDFEAKNVPSHAS